MVLQQDGTPGEVRLLTNTTLTEKFTLVIADSTNTEKARLVIEMHGSGISPSITRIITLPQQFLDSTIPLVKFVK